MKVCCIYKGENSFLKSEDFLSGPSVYEINFIKVTDTSLDTIVHHDYDIIVFDVVMNKGEVSDAHVVTKMQSFAKSTPILLVTNSNELSKYRELMLDSGVDGCLQTPFLQEELFLRLKKLVQKKDGRLFNGTHIDIAGTTMDIRNHTVVVKKEKVALTKTEYSILLHLFLHKNVIVSTAELASCLQEEPKESSLALNIHIFNIRKKIKDTKLIRTVPLYGFMISDRLALV
jgi:DNA-binding response OmpR family regulator